MAGGALVIAVDSGGVYLVKHGLKARQGPSGCVAKAAQCFDPVRLEGQIIPT